MACVSTQRMISAGPANPVDGKVVWTPARSIWTAAMTAIAVIAGPLTFTWDAFALFIVTSAITLCAGHSVGMHRLLIHKSFKTRQWLENTLVYLGTLVGMAGPYGMIRAHDIRDWAQRQRQCHDLYAHRRPFFQDAFWQMHCAVELEHPPTFQLTKKEAGNRFYRFLERTWMLQQLPWAILFFILGGWSWLVWGIAVRVSVSLTGHWLVGHFAHRHGHQGWSVDDVAVQGYNIRHIGLLTFGECWHGNHHAFPESGKLGLEDGQIDPGWWLIKTLEFIGMAKDIRTPDNTPHRKGLRRATARQPEPAPTNPGLTSKTACT